MISRSRLGKQFARYIAVGLLTNGSGVALYLGLTHVGVDPRWAMSSIYAIAIVASFLANSRWTFAQRRSSLGEFWRYAAAYVVGYLANFAILQHFVFKLGFDHTWVQLLTVPVVAVLVFTICRTLVFATERNSDAR